MTNQFLRVCLFSSALALTACTVYPPGEKEERSAALSAGKPFEPPAEKRDLPQLPAKPAMKDLVQYAMLNNADLEARYWQWRSAIEQIPQDGTQTTTLNISFGAAITHGRMSSSGSTIDINNDPMTDIKWPSKLDSAAKIALQNARAAGLRFRAAQRDLRDKVINAYYDYALNVQLLHLEESNQQLLETTTMASEARNRAGSAGQTDVLKARTEADISKSDIANMKSQIPALSAALNALLGRDANQPIQLPDDLPPDQPFTLTSQEILATIDKQNPELLAIDADTRGKVESVHLAKLQYVPDFNLGAGTDLAGITQSLLGQATVPLLRYEAINAAIAQAEANVRASKASRRQTAVDVAGGVVTDTSAIHDADRQLQLFRDSILPHAQQIVDISRSAYESGNSTLLDLLESQRTLISLRRLVINLEVMRARRLADLQKIAGI